MENESNFAAAGRQQNGANSRPISPMRADPKSSLPPSWHQLLALSSWLRQAAAKSDGTKRQFVAVPNLLRRAGRAAYRLQCLTEWSWKWARLCRPELGTLLQVMRRL